MRAYLSIGLFIALAGCGADAGGAAGNVGDAVRMVRDSAVGAGYSSAGPRRCASRTEPAKGPPSAAQAEAYVICGREKDLANVLYLVGDIAVTGIAPGRPYNYSQDNNVPNIDVNRLVYQIRGRLEVYACNRTDTGPGMGPKYTQGSNCSVINQPEATGLCYQDSFGAWDCKLADFNARYGVRVDVPPPA